MTGLVRVGQFVHSSIRGQTSITATSDQMLGKRSSVRDGVKTLGNPLKGCTVRLADSFRHDVTLAPLRTRMFHGGGLIMGPAKYVWARRFCAPHMEQKHLIHTSRPLLMAAQAGAASKEKRKKESTSTKEKLKKQSTSIKEKQKKESTSKKGKKEKRSGKDKIEDTAKAKAAKTSDAEIGICCYAIIPVTDLRKAVSDALPARTRALWEERCAAGHLVQGTQIQLAYYRMQLHDRRIDAWRHCAAFLEKRAWFRFQLTHLIWNERVMVAVVKGLEFDEKEVKNARLDAEKGKQFVDELPEWVHDSLHVRLVISGDDVEPKEARYLVRHWKRNRGDVQCAPLIDVFGRGEMRGLKGRVYKLEYLRQLGRVTSPSYAYDLDFDDRPRDRSRLYSRN